METMIRRNAMKKTVYLIPLSVLLLSGCETMQSSQGRQASARQQAAQRVTEERLRRLQARVESTEAENARLAQELQRVRSETQTLKSQMRTLDISMKNLETKQAQQGQQVVSKVEGLIKKAVSSRPTSRSNRGPGREHIVESGHTLSAIAKAYGTTVQAIKKANHLKSDNIYVGQKLFIPE
jgi:LysM repeat protein